jgi:3-hydroxyisobutyrate dehydrogenase-like beta-hydroxyacid dehydrogenase
MTSPRIAFIGFGEAGPAIASGLAEAGVTDIAAYDILQGDPAQAAAIAARAAKSTGRLAADHADAVKDRDIVVSTVTCTDAVAAAEAAAPHLRASQIYLDVNSVSPATKAAVGAAIQASGAHFVEASIMSPIHPKRHASPMLLSGPAAPKLIGMMAPYGMDLEDMGPEYGRAAATKMFRSIVFKGLEAILQECVVAAGRFGVADKVLQSIGANYPALDWEQLASYFIGRSVMHGKRRAHEMEEVAATLREMGMEPHMAEGAARRIAWLGEQNLKQAFGGREPEHYRDVLAALEGSRRSP